MWLIYKKIKCFLQRSKFLVTLVRFIRAGLRGCHNVRCKIIRSQTIKSYLRTHPIRKLQIGAQCNVLKGWLNTDLNPKLNEVVFLDATKTFPFESATFDYIFCEHLIEHLTYHEGLFMLRECHRVLKPGGKIRIATPNLEILIGLYRSEKSDIQQQYIHWIMNKFLPEIRVPHETFVINNAFRCWGHQFIYDRVILQHVLEEVAFYDIVFYAPDESSDENLRDLESHGKTIEDEDMNRFETMIIEAKCPL